jgi:hypothetical protein
MALSCHDQRPMSSLAFGREWNTQAKLFFVRGFAGLKVVALSFGSAATVIGDSSIAVIPVVAKDADSSDVLQTFATSRVLKEGSIIETVNEPTGNGGLNLA